MLRLSHGRVLARTVGMHSNPHQQYEEKREQAGKSKRISMSQDKLADTAVAAGLAGVEAGVVGMAEGVERLQGAQAVATVDKAALAAGVSDLTRAEDLTLIAEREAVLSDGSRRPARLI